MSKRSELKNLLWFFLLLYLAFAAEEMIRHGHLLVAPALAILSAVVGLVVDYFRSLKRRNQDSK